MQYEPKDFSHLIGTPGFSDALLNNHFTLYQGYVKNVNTLVEKLENAEPGTPEYSELKRRFGWEWNGMRLHELYFENMAKKGTPLAPDSELGKSLAYLYQNHENWEKDFKGTGGMRGIGWAILYFDPVVKRLFNIWVNEHDMGHLTGAVPLLVLDVFEHAYTLDYGIKKADYLDAFTAAIDWKIVEERLAKAL